MAVGSNQMGPGGPGGEFYDENKNQNTVIKPFGSGYTGSGSQSGNQGDQPPIDPMLKQQLTGIVRDKNLFQNQAGLPKYLTNKFKYLFPKGDIDYNKMSGQQKAIADFYAGTTPNAYQQQIQNFMMKSPEGLAAYKDMFPIGGNLNYAMTTLPEKLAEKTMYGQMIGSALGVGDAYTATKELLKKGKNKLKDMFSSDSVEVAQPGADFLNMSQAEYDAYRKNKLAQLPKKNQSAPGSNPFADMLLENMNLNTSTGTSDAEVVSPTIEQLNKKRDSKLDYKAPFFDLAYTLSPTVGDFRENLAGTESYEQPVLDFAMGRAPEIYKEALKTLKNKYPNKSPLDYVGMLDRLQRTPNFPRTLIFNKNFLPSAQTPLQFDNGGLASFYGAYMKNMNKKISDLKASKNKDQFNFLPNQIEKEDTTLDPTMFLPDDQTNRFGVPAGLEPGNSDMVDDEDFSTLLNQYSLLNQNSLADSLIDDPEEELNNKENMSIDINTEEPNDIFGSGLFMGEDPNFPAGGVPEIPQKASGGSVSTYDILKLINDTMNDGQQS